MGMPIYSIVANSMLSVTICLLPVSIFSLSDDISEQIGAHGHVLKTFYNPKLNGIRVDSCYGFGYGCGQSAANAWCNSQGYKRAADFSIAQGAGYTKVISTQEICNHPDCNGFYWIQCVAHGDHEVLPLYEKPIPCCCD